jgi:hypothetical protein
MVGRLPKRADLLRLEQPLPGVVLRPGAQEFRQGADLAPVAHPAQRGGAGVEDPLDGGGREAPALVVRGGPQPGEEGSCRAVVRSATVAAPKCRFQMSRRCSSSLGARTSRPGPCR